LPDRTRPSATGHAERPVVALCAGKDCRKRREYAKIRDVLGDRCTVVDVECLGICSGPVVVARPTSEAPLVLSKLRSKKLRKQLLRVVEDGRPTPPELARHGVSAGERRKAIRRVRSELT
jgi:hypothetical protein